MRSAQPTFVALLTLPALALAGCAAPSEEVDVVATFYPLAFVAERIGGANVTVDTLVPVGVEPHDWEPTTSDVARLDAARLVAIQGAGFEPWLETILANLGSAAPVVVDTTRGLELAASEDAEEGPYDPHTWLDPVLLGEQSKRIEDAMATAFPDDAAALRAGGEALRADLDALHQEMSAALETCEIGVVIANHDAYGYLARRYGFTVEAISGLSPEAEPSPEDLDRVIQVAQEHGIKIVFFEELVSPRVAQVVADEVDAEARVLSPIESRVEGKDYLSLMRENMVNLREAMRCT